MKKLITLLIAAMIAVTLPAHAADRKETVAKESTAQAAAHRARMRRAAALWLSDMDGTGASAAPSPCRRSDELCQASPTGAAVAGHPSPTTTISSGAPEEISCPICRELLGTLGLTAVPAYKAVKTQADNTACQLPCKHCFHVGCIKLWLPTSSVCPLCRRAVDPADGGAAPAAPAVPADEFRDFLELAQRALAAIQALAETAPR